MRRVLPFLLIFLLTACSSPSPPSDRLSIVVSFYAMEDFTRSIAGELCDLRVLVPAGADPHGWEPTIRDMEALENADLFIYSGLGMEPYLPSLRASLRSDALTFVETAEVVTPLTPADGAQSDPHVWLDPRNAIVQMRAILDALCAHDPANSDAYTANFEKLKAEVEALHEQYLSETEAFTRSDLVVSHEAFGYLCAAYGLRQVAIEGLQAESEPTAARMAEIIDYVETNDVRVIFTEELVSPKTSEVIAAQTGAQTRLLSPFESGTQSYVAVMLENLSALRDALK